MLSVCTLLPLLRYIRVLVASLPLNRHSKAFSLYAVTSLRYIKVETGLPPLIRCSEGFSKDKITLLPQNEHSKVFDAENYAEEVVV